MLGKENRIGWPLDGWTKKPQGLSGQQIGSLLQQKRKGNEAVAAGEQNQMLAVWS